MSLTRRENALSAQPAPLGPARTRTDAKRPHRARPTAEESSEARARCEPTLYLHIGLPKAASSYLHGEIFTRLMPERYLMPGASNAKQRAYRYRANIHAVRRFSDAFQRHPAFWRRHGDAFLRHFLAPFLDRGRAGESVLISDEAITRLNHFGIRAMPGAFDGRRLRENVRALDACARKLGFARTRVLLMIRRQDRLLASSYVQLSRKIVGASQEDFERRVHRLIAGADETPDAPFYALDYARLHDCLESVLPREDLCVLPIEGLTGRFDGLVGTMQRFLGMPPSDIALRRRPANARSVGRDRWALRPLLAFKSPRGAVEITIPRKLTGRDADLELRPEMASTIRRHYADENRRLAQAIDTDLGTFGYY